MWRCFTDIPISQYLITKSNNKITQVYNFSTWSPFFFSHAIVSAFKWVWIPLEKHWIVILLTFCTKPWIHYRVVCCTSWYSKLILQYSKRTFKIQILSLIMSIGYCDCWKYLAWVFRCIHKWNQQHFFVYFIRYALGFLLWAYCTACCSISYSLSLTVHETCHYL